MRVFVVAFLAIGFSLPLTAQNVKVSEWKRRFIGSDQATGSIDGPDCSQAYAVQVDLRAPASASTQHRIKVR